MENWQRIVEIFEWHAVLYDVSQSLTVFKCLFFTVWKCCFIFSRNMFSYILKAIVHIHLIVHCHILVLLVCNMVICQLHYKVLAACMILNKILCCVAISSYMTNGCMKCGMFCFVYCLVNFFGLCCSSCFWNK